MPTFRLSLLNSVGGVGSLVRRWCGSKFGVGGVGPQNFVGSVEGGVGRNFRFGGADQKKGVHQKK